MTITAIVCLMSIMSIMSCFQFFGLLRLCEALTLSIHNLQPWPESHSHDKTVPMSTTAGDTKIQSLVQVTTWKECPTSLSASLHLLPVMLFSLYWLAHARISATASSPEAGLPLTFKFESHKSPAHDTVISKSWFCTKIVQAEQLEASAYGERASRPLF